MELRHRECTFFCTLVIIADFILLTVQQWKLVEIFLPVCVRTDRFLVLAADVFVVEYF